MSKKLDSITLSDKIIEKMKENIDIARDKQIESGFSLCRSNKDLHEENQCIGTLCELIQSTICEKGEFVGTFHTHPLTEIVEPSITDMLSTYKYGFSCIGSPALRKDKKYEIKCLLRKGNMEDKILDKLARGSIKEMLPSMRALIPTREVALQKIELENIRTEARKLFDIVDII